MFYAGGKKSWIGRRSVAVGFCAAFILLVLTISVRDLRGDEHDAATGEDSISFGSQSVLDHCWTSSDLESRLKSDNLFAAHESPPESATPVKTSALPPLTQRLRRSIRSVKPDGNRKLVALTFDLCESRNGHSGYDGGIVNYLRKEKIRATFFTGGKWMRSHPERAMQLIADPLFEIGNHSDTHLNLHLQSIEEIDRQVLAVQNEYRRVLGRLTEQPCAKGLSTQEWAKIPSVPKVFRFPFGRCDERALERVNTLGLVAVQWNLVTADAAPKQAAKTIAKTVLAGVRPGSIVVAHANGRGHGTARALQLIIPELRRNGYEFVTVSELLSAGTPEGASECYEVYPGDNKRYDASRYNR